MNRKKPGITLIELVIAMAITVTVLGIAGSMFTTGNKVFSDSDVKSTLQIEGQAIQEKISDIGMQGIEVVSESPLIITSYVKGDDDKRYFKIMKDNNNLLIYKDSNQNFSNGETPIVYGNIRSLTMTPRNGNKSIDFTIVLTRKSVDYTIAFTINLRNKDN